MSGAAPYVCIMAGGKGERFWPVSRAARPKQLTNIVGTRSMIAETVVRNQHVTSSERIYVVTTRAQAAAVGAAVPELLPANVVGEPRGRNTAPCIGLICALLAARDADAVLAVVPADHCIPDAARYAQTVRDAAAIAQREQALLTIGIDPAFPETGYGYILAGAAVPYAGATRFSRVEQFIEKPPRARAEELIATGRAFWNAGMFVFRVRDMLAALATHVPAMTAGLTQVTAAARAGDAAAINAAMDALYAAAPAISIDYAVMEKATNVIVAHGAFVWDDVGSWLAVAAHWPRDAQGNATRGAVLTLDTRGSVVRNDAPGVVAVLGMRDVVVVRTADAVLVCPKDRAQDVKKIVQALRADETMRGLVE